MMPMRTLFKDELLGFMPHLRPELRSTTLPAFYAAFRKALTPGGPGHSAHPKGDGLRLGVAEVRLGPSDRNWDALVASDRTNTFMVINMKIRSILRSYHLRIPEMARVRERADGQDVSNRYTRQTASVGKIYLQGSARQSFVKKSGELWSCRIQ